MHDYKVLRHKRLVAERYWDQYPGGWNMAEFRRAYINACGERFSQYRRRHGREAGIYILKDGFEVSPLRMALEICQRGLGMLKRKFSGS